MNVQKVGIRLQAGMALDWWKAELRKTENLPTLVVEASTAGELNPLKFYVWTVGVSPTMQVF